MEGHITVLRRGGKIRSARRFGTVPWHARAMPRQITVDELARMLAAAEPVRLLDVRQSWEHDIAALPASLLIPLAELDDRWSEVEAGPRTLIVAYCHHGVRSLNAAAFLETKGIGPVASLAGGIDAWSLHMDPKIPRY
jgi:rhodanese-related sulfurtransferase